MPDGEHVDNCQHVTLGCCTNLDDFYRRVGSADKIKFFDRLFFLDPQGRRGTMQAGILPAPISHDRLVPTFAPLSLEATNSPSRRAMFDNPLRQRQNPQTPRAKPRGISMLEWLHRRKQTPRAIERFWRVVLVSALDEELDHTDARFGIDVFWKAFLTNSTGYRMGVPIVPLAELYDGCRASIEKHGGEVTCARRSAACALENGTLNRRVQFDSGREESADAYVFAVPHDASATCCPRSPSAAPIPRWRNLQKIKVAPITGVHFWFDREVMDEPFVTLARHQHPVDLQQDRALRPLQMAPRKIEEQYLQLVISASYDLLKKSRQEIIDLCLKRSPPGAPAAAKRN